MFDRALKALPVSQHDKIWKLYIKWAENSEFVPLETGCSVFERYIGGFRGEAADRYLNYLMAHRLFDRACTVLISIL